MSDTRHIATETDTVTTSSMSRRIMISVAGSTIEWYDFFVYGAAAALVLGKLFFPSVDPLAGTLLAFSTFAVGFLVRPLGAALFGHWGDAIGRKRALVAAMTLMGAATTAIGLLPTYAVAGAAAPVLLVGLRVVQGLALGGQWGGSVLVVTEHAPAARRGFFGSFSQLGVPLALIISNLVLLAMTAALPTAAFESWGWRVPFLLSVVLIAVSAWAQRGIAEPERPRRSARSPIVECLRTHPVAILLAAGATIVNAAVYYLLTTYVLAFATSQVGVTRASILTAVLVSALVSVPLIPAAAALSDRIGRRLTFTIGAVGLAVWAFPVFWLIETRTAAGLIVGLVVAQVLFSMTYGPAPALFTEMFAPGVRYSGVSIGYQLGATVGGGFAPIIATALYGQFHSSTPVSLYMIIVCAISVVSVALVRRRDTVA